jgi:L-threonylcarbamoyladenylate synthase
MQIATYDTSGVIETTAELLRSDQAVIVPTDTVYGLAALPTMRGAIDRIYAVKNRPDGVPLVIIGSNSDQFTELGVDFSEYARKAANIWWPGPLTIAVGFHSDRPRPDWLSGRVEVALRIPNCQFLLDLCTLTGPLLVTSANRHGMSTQRTLRGTLEQLNSELPFAVDGGKLQSESSTLLNVRSTPPSIERIGAVQPDDIRRVISEAVVL